MGGCYLSLRDYLALPDDSEGADERRAEAKSFVKRLRAHAARQPPRRAAA